MNRGAALFEVLYTFTAAGPVEGTNNGLGQIHCSAMGKHNARLDANKSGSLVCFQLRRSQVSQPQVMAESKIRCSGWDVFFTI